ncbi:DUF2321 domain-containing protein [Staphylococcus schweitzeri]|uniref:DUF2321 domain-containing protein n=1 Tax=Staphylococcus schweitzeri TaxID=1654388 RepID=UPI00050047DE|nr:DUF2321 domain-containing protein [Staphylococcus schweitzeri]CDR51752.1 Uncharacterized protein conserved in bacteria [Staphylococcus schweitzeri]
MTGYYEWATICLNGHVASSSEANYVKFCKECGKSTVSQCNNCGIAIQGNYYVPEIIGIFKYDLPYYCHNCGSPYPWTKTLLDNAVELVSLDDELPEEHKKIIKNAIPDLIIESPTTPLAQAKYKKYAIHAADYVQEGLKNLLVDIVSESVKKSIFN